MARPGLLLDGAVLYLATGLPIAIIGAIYSVPLGVELGALLVLLGLLFLLVLGLQYLRHRTPRPAVE
ncbi:MAG: hypothetical protein ACLQD8_02190 [Thermoplasmata archaeon]